MGRRRRRQSELTGLRFLPGQPPLKLSRGLQPGDHITICPETLEKKGDGRAWVLAEVGPQGEARTYTIDVRRALPGEEVEVALESRRRTTFKARVLVRHVDSPHRVSPRCPHFGERETPGKGCGGCSLQSLSYPEQLAWKHDHVERLLSQAGLGVLDVRPVLGMEDPYFYRNKMEFSFGDDRDRGLACGLFPQGWHNEVINLEACFLQSEASTRLLDAVRSWCFDAGLVPYKSRTNAGFLRNLTIREGKRTSERLIELVTTADETVEFRGESVAVQTVAQAFSNFIGQVTARAQLDVTSVYWTQVKAVRGERTRTVEHHLAGTEVLHEEFHLADGRRLRFQIHPRSFFQPNTFQGERLADTVVELALRGKEAGDVPALGRVLDLYCGAGNLCLCVAPHAVEALGVELVPEAVADAERNAALNGMTNLSFVAADVGEWLASEASLSWREGVDLVLLDPPRAGLIGAAIEQLEAVGPKRIIYVSCNPEALARDLVSILALGYAITDVRPLDMFPHTAHVETVVALSRELTDVS